MVRGIDHAVTAGSVAAEAGWGAQGTLEAAGDAWAEFAGGTKFDFTLNEQDGFLTQISLYPDSGGTRTATPVTLRKGGLILHELTSAANKALLVNNDMDPANAARTANIYDIVLDHDDTIGSALPLDSSRDVSLTIEAAAAMSGTITAIIERIGFPE
jgi:hypothetical protein